MVKLVLFLQGVLSVFPYDLAKELFCRHDVQKIYASLFASKPENQAYGELLLLCQS